VRIRQATPPAARSPASQPHPGTAFPYVSSRQVEAFLGLMASGLEAGLTPSAILRSGAAHGLPEAVGKKLIEDADGGIAFSTTAGTLDLLDAGSIALLRAKEAHGELPDALKRVAERLKKKRQATLRLLVLLAYPSAMALAAILIIPAPVLFTLGLGAYLHTMGPWLGLFVSLLVFFLLVVPRIGRRSALRRQAVAVANSIPVVRGIVLNRALADFADVLGASLGAGLSARESLLLAAEAAPHPSFQGQGPRLVHALESGAPLTQAVSQLRTIPAGFLAQVAPAEQAGKLDSVLPRLREDHDARSRRTLLATIAAVGGAVMLLAMGLAAVHIVSGWTRLFEGRNSAIESQISD